MIRLLTVALLMAGLLLGVPAVVLAADVDTIAEELEGQAYYLEPGAEAVDEDALRRALTGSRINGVVLASEPPGGEEALADELLDAIGGGETVIVVSPIEVGVASDGGSDRDIDLALTQAENQIDFGSTDAGAIIIAFGEAFDEVRFGDGAAQESDRGGFPVGTLLVVGGLGVFGLVVLASRWRSRRTQEERREQQVAEAREEVRRQVETMAEQILQLTDRVELAGNEETTGLFHEATGTYQEAQHHLERSTSAAELEQVSDKLDHGRWQLQAVAALLEGREPPPQPEQEQSCFFDPTHGAGVEEATIDTPAGQQKVRVCSYCAAKLQAGQAPEPRMIQVGGRQIPAAKAPRSYGGGGLSWLENFSIILGGHRHPYGWGGYRGGWGVPGSGWGGGWSGRSGRRRGFSWPGGLWGTGGFGGGDRSSASGGRSRSSGRSRGFGGASRSSGRSRGSGGGSRGGGSRGRGGRRR